MRKTLMYSLTLMMTATSCVSEEQQQNADDCCACLATTDPGGADGVCLAEGESAESCSSSFTTGYTLGIDAVDTELVAASCITTVCLDACRPLVEEGFRFAAPAESAGTLTATIEGVSFESTFTTVATGPGAEANTRLLTVTGTNAGGETLILALSALPDGAGTYPLADFSAFEVITGNGDAQSGSLVVTVLDATTFAATFSGDLSDTDPPRLVEGSVSVRLDSHDQDGDIDLTAYGAPDNGTDDG